MSVKINGAVYRNIPGEAEGIDTPSLTINGAPLSGGTQLYKHSLANFAGTTPLIVYNLSADKINSHASLVASLPIQMFFNEKLICGWGQTGFTEFTYYGFSEYGQVEGIVTHDWETVPVDTVTPL